MINIYKISGGRYCKMRGDVAELIADVAVSVDSLATIITNDEEYPINDKEEAVEFVISAVYKGIKSAQEEKKER